MTRTGGKCAKTIMELFTDDVFLDFFNTFLNLPVFGQTPLYFLSDNKWHLCPEIPHSKDVKRGSFFQWLRAHRFVHFKHTDLYHHYFLCKELLLFPPSQAQEVLKWTLADLWLLKRCLGSVRGMRRFCSFLKGTRGEELVTFCVRVERLLQMDWQDVSQRNSYQALFTVIKAVHLSEASSIMATCRISPDRLLEIVSGTRPDGMRERLLARMRSKALTRLRSYWLPRYLSACKAAIAGLEECASVAREYEDVASGLTPVDRLVPPDPEGWILGSEPSEGPTVTRTYCSKVRKRVLWRAQQRRGTGRRVGGGGAGTPDGPVLWQWLPMAGEGDRGECNNIVHYMSRRGEEIVVDCEDGQRGTREGRGARPAARVESGAPLRRASPAHPWRPGCAPLLPVLPSKSLPRPDRGSDVVPPHACTATPIFHLPAIVGTAPLSPPPPPPSPSIPVRGRGPDVGLSLALSADALAGGPYGGFLRARGWDATLRLLGLWQELDGLLGLLLETEDGPSGALRQIQAGKIADVYLSDDGARGGEGEGAGAALSESTVTHLKCLLPSGNVMPWIHAAKRELSQILAPTYDAFLDEEDKHFLFYLFGKMEVKGKVIRGSTAPSGGPGAPEQQVRRMREALALCRACCGHTRWAEPLSEETWSLLPLEDVRRGGSIHLHYRKTDLYDLPFETLARRYPKQAVEEISKTHRLYCYRKPVVEEAAEDWVASSADRAKKSRGFVGRPSAKPRSMGDVLKSAAGLDFFKRFLRAYDAHGALIFYREVDKLRNMERVSQQKAKINSIVARFLRRADAEEYLQCSANLITHIPKMRDVSPDALFTAQDLVMKALEANWFKKYQDTFPPSADVVDSSARTAALTNKMKQKHVWIVFSRFIKNICTFRNAMKDILIRSKFEAYLRQNWHDFTMKNVLSVGNRQIESVGLCAEEGDSSHLKRRVVNNKLITVDFLVNDLSFYLETESFRKMADSGAMMASAGMYGENDHALLHQKADMILQLFLKSELSPKLRINIAESARESIQQSFAMGKVDRGLFHEAIVAIFPNLIFCWKKFCSQTSKRGKVGDRDARKEDVVVLPDYLRPFSSGSNWYRKIQTTVSVTEDYSTLHFTVFRGLNLVLPQTRLDLKLSCGVLSPKASPVKQRSASLCAVSPLPSLEMNNQRTSAGQAFLRTCGKDETLKTTAKGTLVPNRIPTQRPP